MVMNDSLNQLIKIFYKQFGIHPNFSLDDYLHSYGKESHALLYSVLFFPELIEIESSIFLKRNINDESFLKNEILNIKANQKNISEIESNFNFIEIGYLFDCNGRDISEDEEIFLAERIKDSWSGWLKIKYPDRKFIVEILLPHDTGSTVGVQFYELRSL